MNVLSRGRVPSVMSLQGACCGNGSTTASDVLVRRSKHRLAEIARRLEILGGYLIAYLNLDEVIRIIREEDEPKPALMERFDLTDIQAEAILNMRLRALRKLEEIEIRKEHKALTDREEAARGAARLRRRSSGRRSPTGRGSPQQVRQEDRAWQAPHRFRRRARA